MLQHVFQGKHLSDDLNFDTLAVKTEGFVVQDLVDLANRAIFESYRTAGLIEPSNEDFTEKSMAFPLEIRPISPLIAESHIITLEHCQTALETVSEISLQNVDLFTSGERDFSDIGGLENVKTILIENLVWPLQVVQSGL